MTTEAMISALSKANTSIEESVGCFINDELLTLIDKSKLPLINDLTKLYDCKDFEYETRGRGKEAVKNPCLSIYGGCTLHGIKEIIPIQAIGGGFTSRIVFVYKASRERNIPWPNRSAEDRKRFDTITHDLNEVARMRGPMGITADAKSLFEIQYEEFLEGPLLGNPYLSGYVGRRHITLLKTAIAFSASRSNEREIDKDDMWRAINALKNSEGSMNIVYRALTSEACGEVWDEVMALILSYGAVYRSKLIQETRHRINHRELDLILEGCIEAKLIKKEAKNGKILYTLVKKKE